MDFFESRYYWLNKKLLLLIGQWPYQDQTSRIQRNIFVWSMTFSICVVQIFASQVIVLICVLKYFNYSINKDKIKALLEVIKIHWKSLNDSEENKIVEDTTERGRLYALFCTLYIYSALLLITFVTISPLILDIVMPINGSHTRTQILPAEYFVDEEKYFYPIFMHTILLSIILLTILIATDTLYVMCIYHACAMFNVVSHRLKHAFDKYNNEKESEQNRREIFTRIANAVECHTNVTEYTDDIISTFGISIFLTIFFALINISVTLYSTITSLEEEGDTMISLVMATSQVTHMMIMFYPPQKLHDNSAMIYFKAYSAKWYAAPIRMQSLLIPIMIRSTRPSIITVGGIMSLTLENSCAIIQTSISYCTVLLSFR